MVNKFKTDKDLVGYVLSAYPETRNSDTALLLKVWELQGLHLTHEQRQLFTESKLSNAESLRRVRQKYQEEGLYPADPGVERHRRRNEQEVQQTIKSLKVTPSVSPAPQPKLKDMTQSTMFDILPKRNPMREM